MVRREKMLQKWYSDSSVASAFVHLPSIQGHDWTVCTRNLLVEYIGLMVDGKSLDKISKALHINKKMVFGWRYKILSSLSQDSGDDMKGIVESDETFFEGSEKDNRHLTRKAHKRGRSSFLSQKKTRGVSSAVVIATADRSRSMNLRVVTMGRIGKGDIMRSIEKPFPAHSIFCTDKHISYKGFVIDNQLEHVTLRVDLNQRVKQGIYHIQNVNPIHNRLKKGIDNTFWGVSTQYLQNYFGWFRWNEKLKNSTTYLRNFIFKTVQDTNTLKRYNYIGVSYRCLLTTQ